MQDSSFDLTTIGAGARVFEAFETYAGRGLMLGRVSIVYRDEYRLYTATGEAKAEAVGAFLYRAQGPADLPAVGDWVACKPVRPGEAMIHDVLPRATQFSRRAAGQQEREQVLAANIDLVLIVCGLDRDYSVPRIERYLTLAHESGAQAAIVLNKVDLCADVSSRVDEVERIARSVPVIAICARSMGDVQPVLRVIRAGSTIALLGSSGAGKSTLVNRLLGEERQSVQEVRESDGRGRHTTTHRALVPLPGGGALIDTPGLRELQLWAGRGSLDSAFDDVAELAVGCRYRNCSHTAEDGCAVRAALASGELDTGRWGNYCKLRAEIAWHERKTDVVAAQAEKKRWKRIHKAMRSHKIK
jgi:ribosome biogenesis GTPase